MYHKGFIIEIGGVRVKLEYVFSRNFIKKYEGFIGEDKSVHAVLRCREVPFDARGFFNWLVYNNSRFGSSQHKYFIYGIPREKRFRTLELSSFFSDRNFHGYLHKNNFAVFDRGILFWTPSLRVFRLFFLKSDNSSVKENTVDTIIKFIYTKLFWHNKGLFFHSSGIINYDKAFLFLGSCGAGKTTIARQSGNFLLLSDEVVGIRQCGKKFYGFSTPWGQQARAERTNAFTAIVDSIFFLSKDKKLWFEGVSPSRAITRVLAGNSHIIFFLKCAAKGEIRSLMDFLCDLTMCIPTWNMHFPRNANFWPYLPEKKGGKNEGEGENSGKKEWQYKHKAKEEIICFSQNS